MSGESLKVEASAAGGLSVYDGRGRTASILATDVHADNAVIQVISQV